MRSTLVGVIAAAVAALAGQASAQPPGNAAKGLEYVRHYCADCHAVEAGATVSAVSKAPSFQVVADTPGMTYMALNVWLHSAHKAMPQFVVSQANIPDIAAYLASMHKASQPPKDKP